MNLRLISLCAAPLLGGAHAVLAQDSAPPADPAVMLSPFEVRSGGATGYSAATSVSATRMRVDLQAHPQSIAVVTSELLADVDATTITDALRYVAGVQPYGSVEGRFSIRGSLVNSVKRNGFDTAAEAISDMVFTDRVEVIKGPASLLYGLGTPGGIINIITKRPSGVQSQSLKLQVNSEGAWRGELDAGGPLGKSGSGYRIMGALESGDTFAYLEKNRKQAIGGSFVWQALPKTKLTFDFNYLRYNPIERTMSLPINNARTDYVHVPRDWSIGGPNSFRNTIERNIFATLDQQLGDHFYFRNYFESYNSTSRFFRRNVDSALAGNVNVNATSTARDFDRLNWVDQSDLVGRFENAAGKLQFDAGFTYNDSIQRDAQWNQAGAAYAANPFPILAYNTTPLTSKLFALGSNAFTGPPTTNWQHVEIEDRAFYGLIQYTFWHDRVNFFGGVRRDGVDQELNDRIAKSRDNTSTTFTLPQVGVSYTPVKPLSFYVSYSNSAQANADFPQTPQKGKGVDAGFKFNVNNRLSGSVAYFHTELNNIQRAVPGTTVTVLSGQEKYQGVDVDLVFSPVPAWQMIASYSYADSRVTKDTVAVAVNRQVPSTPLNSFNFWNKYTFKSGALRNFFVGGGLNARSSEAAFVPSNNNYLVRTAGFTKYDLLAGWSGRWGNLRTSLQVNVENVTDKVYIDRPVVYGLPRTTIVTLNLAF